MNFRDRLHFDADAGEFRDGGIRYMMIRPDALMGIFTELPEAMRLPALQAFARSVTRHGGRSAETYDQGRLAEVIAETAPQLGWGRWNLELDEHSMHLVVHNSPFAAGYGRSTCPVCHPIVGMLAAIGPMIFSAPVTVSETACAATGSDACRFEVKLLSVRPSRAAGEPPPENTAARRQN